MKRIIQILVCLVFMGITFLLYQNFSTNELSNIMGSSYYIVDIQEKDDFVIDALNLVSKKKDVLIGKINYEYSKDSSGKLSIYLSDYNESFFDKIFIKNINKKKLGNNNYYTTNKNDTNENVIGYISMLGADAEFSVKSLNDLDIKSSNNSVFIDARNDNDLFDILNELRSNGVSANYTPEDYYFKSNTFDIFKNVVNILVCIALFLLLAIVYTIFKNYKKFAILEMLGYSKKQIIFHEFIKYLKLILILISLFMLIILSMSFIKYSNLNLNLIFNFIQYYSLLGFLLLIVIYVSLQLVYLVDIKNMIKNKYPFKFIFNFSIVAKIIVSVVLIITIINSYIIVKSITLEKNNSTVWNRAKSLYYTQLHNFEPDISGSYFEIGSKFQNLYSNLNSENAILFRYGLIDEIGGIKLDQTQNNEFISYSIYINNNYLIDHPVYDSNNKRINNLKIDNNLIILLPEKYKSIDIEDALSFNAKQLRYYDENLYRKYHKLPELNSIDYKVEFIYIKNNQKFFSYDESVNKKNSNYIFDPIIYICNDKNMPTDFYISAFSNGEIYFENSSKGLILSNHQIDNYVVGITNAYSKISTLIIELENRLNLTLVNFIITLLVYVLILILTSLYYFKMNSIKFILMRIHGYTTWNMARKYIVSNTSLSSAIIILLLYLKEDFTIPLISIFIIAIIFEIIILYSTLMISNTLNRISNEITK